MIKLTSPQIAQKILDLMEEHENSWDEQSKTYKMAAAWDVPVRAFLVTQEHSSLALVLRDIAFSHYNEMQDWCEAIIEKNLN